ncbi:MAG: GNAT family N-acetyltransferase [Erythrobacter sp.]|uniref:GNAT family N-acetyltransferase n=1 Tax=Erythrobacter sp. TaxID=1042 RepID=UPI00260C592C|nr:GNAT family N-acetyltransferase [Erythrobacter sp.]MDJ0977585.1 GNAT family N-acetyltransferase [Erythrobacter sp.]
MSKLNFTQPSILTSKRFSNREAETDWSDEVTTAGGAEILITPARPDDTDALERFFEGVARRDLYFRFLSGMRKVDDDRLAEMVDDTNDRTIDFLAFDPGSGEVLASAMLGADESFESAEFAVCTREDMKQKGISWALLDHAVRYAKAMGVKRITSLESAEQRDALRLEREMGFKIKSSSDHPGMIIAEKVL